MADNGYVSVCVDNYLNNGQDFSMLENIVENAPGSMRESIARGLQRELVLYSIPDTNNRVMDAIAGLEKYKQINRACQIRNLLQRIKKVQFTYCIKLVERFEKYCLEEYRKRKLVPELDENDIVIEGSICYEILDSQKFKILMKAIQDEASYKCQKQYRALQSII